MEPFEVPDCGTLPRVPGNAVVVSRTAFLMATVEEAVANVKISKEKETTNAESHMGPLTPAR